jgi:hypothetical protein
MISMSAAFEAAIAQSMVRIAELYTCELANGTIYRYTTHQKDVIWDAGGNTYQSVAFERGPIRRNTNGEFDEVELSMGNISGDLWDMVHKNVLDAAEVTIRRFRWDASFAADEEIEIFRGTPNIGFDRKTLTLTAIAEGGSLNILVPRHVYQPSCNHGLFDTTCGLTQSDYGYSGTATGGTASTLIDATAGVLYKVDFDAGDSGNPIEIGDTVTGQVAAGTGVVVQIIYLTASTGTLWYLEQSGVQFVDDEELQNAGADSVVCNGVPAEDVEFWQGGELRIDSGANNGERRPILSNLTNTRTACWPFPSAIVNGVSYTIFPGCDGRAVTCDLRYNNKEKFRGFPHVPPVEEVIFSVTG